MHRLDLVKAFASLAAATLGITTAAAAEGPPFADAASAQVYLKRALPEATAANPKYKDADADTETRWLTRTVDFKRDADGAAQLSMQEDILKYRGDQIVERGSHSVQIPLDATGVGLISADWKPVESLDEAAGILFKCPKEACIRSERNGKTSLEPQTDITISDRETLAKLYDAFRALLKTTG